MLGETWSAPLCVIDEDDIRGSCEKELATKEHCLKKKKPQPKAKAAAATSNAIQLDDDVWSIPSSDDGGTAKPGKAAKASADKDAASAAAAARKAERERASTWRKESAKAAKLMGSLNSVCQQLGSTQIKVEKNADLFTADLIDSLKAASETVLKFKTSSWTALIKLVGIHVRL